MNAEYEPALKVSIHLKKSTGALGFIVHHTCRVENSLRLQGNLAGWFHGFKSRDSGFEIRASGFEFWVSGFGIRVSGSGFRACLDVHNGALLSRDLVHLEVPVH